MANYKIEDHYEVGPFTEGPDATSINRYLIRATGSSVSKVGVKNFLEQEAPQIYDDLNRQSWTVTFLGGDWFEGEVRYSHEKPKEPGQSRMTFDTSGGTTHITQSIKTINKYPKAEAPDFKGAIGVTHDSVQGVDITIPVFQFSETHYFAPEFVGDAYLNTIRTLTGKKNTGMFRGFFPGEVLFLGASGGQRGNDDWEIAFKFAASVNQDNLKVGSITGIQKSGWDYLWVRYQDEEDTAKKVIVKQPKAVYVEQLYQQSSFGQLQIG